MADNCLPLKSLQNLKKTLSKAYQLDGGSKSEFEKVALSAKSIKLFMAKNKDEHIQVNYLL